MLDQATRDAVMAMSMQDLQKALIAYLEDDAKRRAAQKRYVTAHKEERKAYSQRRAQKQRAMLARARELGLDKEV
jgi:hypothetical protein